MGFDLDDVFAYTTTRKVAIRDRYLGLTYLAAQIAILGYVVVYQIGFQQAYLDKSSLTGVTRMSLRRPATQYRWNGAAPYCIGTNSSDSPHYAVLPGDKYHYIDHTGKASIEQMQATCLYLDNKYAVSSDAEVNAFFLPTRISITSEQISPYTEDCQRMEAPECSWSTTATNVTYVADASMYTLMVDHSFSATNGLAYNVRQMNGVLYDNNGNEVDPCDDYAEFDAGCPNFVTAGGGGVPSIFPIQTLLRAAGIDSLDNQASKLAPLSSETLRYAGLVMVIDIEYTNFYLPGDGVNFGTGSFDADVVKFAYSVTVVPDQDFKSELVVPAAADRFSPARTGYNQHGVRIIVRQTGRVGIFDFQTLLINLTVSLGLLSVAAVITDFAAFSLCPGRSIYRQYRLRRTVDMSDIRQTGRADEIMKKFDADPNLVDPIPPILKEALSDKQRLIEDRVRRMQELEMRNGVGTQQRVVPVDTSLVDFAIESPLNVVHMKTEQQERRDASQV